MDGRSGFWRSKTVEIVNWLFPLLRWKPNAVKKVEKVLNRKPSLSFSRRVRICKYRSHYCIESLKMALVKSVGGVIMLRSGACDKRRIEAEKIGHRKCYPFSLTFPLYLIILKPPMDFSTIWISTFCHSCNLFLSYLCIYTSNSFIYNRLRFSYCLKIAESLVKFLVKTS